MGDHLCTLRELETYYSYADALDMAEILTVRRYNERLAMEEAGRK